MNLMNKAVVSAVAILFAAVLPASAAVKSTVKFDPAKSEIKWVGKKVTGEHNGAIKLKSGQAILEGDTITGGEFVVDMPSLTVLDLKDASNAKLTGHLKSDDFFGVEKYPTATFVLKEAKAMKDAATGTTHQISGDLTIKGKTSPATFPATVSLTKTAVKADATITVDRTVYDIRYGSGKFFENLGDKTIHDNFTLQIHLEGTR